MATFRAYVKKELIESIRQYKFLIIAIGIILFAVFDPVMLKLLPLILKSQSNLDLSSIIIINKNYCFQNYIKDLFQIGLMFIIFTSCTSLSEEISSQKLVFPYAKGASPASIVLAKFINFAAPITLFTIIGILLNYYYVGILYSGESVSLSILLKSSILICVFYIFNLSLVLFLSSITKRGLSGGIITLVFSYVSAVIYKLPFLLKFLPYNLIAAASSFKIENIGFTIIITLTYTVMFLYLTIIRMNKIEVI
ncbi:MAG: hypothetical protein K0R54_948 [Clostridiaceae bacterium]|jgi:ABC-2 type transport system permease protein|nr:hypothetical protein [Clostridiaceae bacterium]